MERRSRRSPICVEAPNYSDRRVASGKRYRYAISAVDLLGNESARSQPVEAAAQ